MATKFNELKPGDLILSLEMNRRTLCPILEPCKVLKVSKEFTDRVGNTYGRLVKLEIMDSTQESFEVTLEAESNGSIYDRVFYSTSPEDVYQELQLQKQKAQSVIDNIPKYKLCIEECDKAMMRIAPPENNSPSKGISTQDIEQHIQSVISKQLEPVNQMVKTLYNSLVSGESKPENPE